VLGRGVHPPWDNEAFLPVSENLLDCKKILQKFLMTFFSHRLFPKVMSFFPPLKCQKMYSHKMAKKLFPPPLKWRFLLHSPHGLDAPGVLCHLTPSVGRALSPGYCIANFLEFHQLFTTLICLLWTPDLSLPRTVLLRLILTQYSWISWCPALDFRSLEITIMNTL